MRFLNSGRMMIPPLVLGTGWQAFLFHADVKITGIPKKIIPVAQFLFSALPQCAAYSAVHETECRSRLHVPLVLVPLLLFFLWQEAEIETIPV